jgi:hypothetical protein
MILRTTFLFALTLFFALGLMTAFACTSKPTATSALDGDYQTPRDVRKTVEGHHLQYGTLA